ncbi:hypothetical protein AWH62_05675 [Maricaulis sp. W15]|uniref:hypothetical protein n=1 Tax=Maricaulis sp. W15 TaxID=1772333 RepID=UPI000948FA9B|nr:hypothetical protein [Maricaulis sp. W15]OLF75309.1 hypothetical protein AWH62_05675 [Maricaulis sp. W15]
MEDQVSKLIRQRDRVLALAAVSFLFWQGAQLAENIVEEGGWDLGPYELVVQLVLVAGALGWAGASFLFLLYANRVRRSETQSVIQDELFCHNQRIAIRCGFVALIGATSVLLAADLFIGFSATIALRALLITGITAPLVTFLILGRDNLEDDA